MYDNDLKERKIKFKPRIKSNHNIYIYISTARSGLYGAFIILGKVAPFLRYERWILACKLERKCPGQATFSAGNGPGTDE